MTPPSDQPLRVIFAGTPAFAVPSLQALIDLPEVEVVAVYTQPDRAAGRGRQMKCPEVKQLAQAHGIPVEQPLTWRDEATLARIAAWRPELLVVAAYGLILPEAGLQIPPLGAINVHASLLPRWRGAAPIQRAIMAGDAETGVTIMQVVRELDAGPMLHRVTCPIDADDTAGTLEARLAHLGAEALTTALRALRAGAAVAEPQDAAAVTYAAKITREDREIDWQRQATALARQIRALNPAPLAHTEALGIPVNLLKAVAIPETSDSAPGSLLAATSTGIDIACGEGVLRIEELQPQGKRIMSARDFVNGYGARLGVSSA
ncbi:MAG: hypothetical protein RL434_538 [Pseudomonadota bacterium]